MWRTEHSWRGSVSGWRNVPTPPPRTSGRLVIQDDDGYLGGYQRAFALLQTKGRAANHWRGHNPAPFSPAVNTGRIGLAGRMTPEHLREIVRSGGEVCSHGRWHHGLTPNTLQDAVTSGATRLPVDRVNRWQVPYRYEISGGGNSETVLVTDRDMDANEFVCEPLTNGYPSGSTLRVIEEDALEELQGTVDDLAEWGITARNHVWAWNENDEVSRAWAATIFDSARGAGESPVSLPGQEPYDLRGANISTLNNAAIDAFLSALIADDAVGFVYEHGYTNALHYSRLVYLVDQALARGVRIVTHSEAAAFLAASD